jgi:hypothetical protein
MTPVERNDERWLEDTMGALRREDAAIVTPARVEARVMAGWDAAFGPQSSPTLAGSRLSRTLRYTSALAAGLVLVAGLGRLGQGLRDGALTRHATERATLLFVGEPILDGEAVRIVRMRIPAATLANLGMRSTATDPAAAVDVDVLVGEDGVARAVRY